jgi:uncharacterized protein YbcI
MVGAGGQEVQISLAQALQEFWQVYTGVSPTHVQVVASEQFIVVWLEDVLSPGERQMANTQPGRKALQEIEERILEQARPQLQRLVEGVLGQESILVQLHLDVSNGSVLGLFRLGSSISTPSSV